MPRPPDGEREVRALRAELAEVREQLREAHETIEMIRSGGAESLVIGPPGQEQIYALASADRTYRLLVEAMNEGAATLSADGIILDANPRLAAMTGRAAAELIGTPVTGLVTGGQLDTLCWLIDVGAGGSSRGEVELTGPAGEAVPVQLATSGFDLGGTLLRCMVLTDLTAQRDAEAGIQALNAELEARVQQRTAELVRANKNMEAFSYSIAHDLRAPLRAMTGYSEALLEDCGDLLDESCRRYAASIQAASERMALLIDDLLQLSRISRAEITATTVDLSAEVAAIVAELRSAEPGRRVRLVIQRGVLAAGDRGLIRTVLQNLLENAWKFTAKRENATIEFGAAAAGGSKIRCHVRDNGAGFDPGYADMLFQPFQRLHAASEFPGTGIGLASVRQVIQRHGGEVWAEGAPGEGATFYLTLDLPT